jgi:exopolyphosphatase/guanosine-5'-triphosphate,3'-diphosphate pyrophosphatase
LSKDKDFRTEPPKYRPVAVTDIGSNSVRLVVYDGLRRSPTPVFNEKILCGLGKGLALTNRLGDEAMARALGALRRFRALSRQIGVERHFAVATAAAREASNGAQFVAEAEEALGVKIDVLTGKEEARYAALGVMAGIPEADGLVGDLGGGSLELVDVKNDTIGDGVTLPLGPLRLIDLSDRSMGAAKKIVDNYLDDTPLIQKLPGRSFYAVGGTWRNLLRLHMARSNYPLHVLHDYTISRDQARSAADHVAHLTPSSLRDIRTLSKSRAETMPFGALVLDRLLSRGKPAQVVASVFGVREGLLYSKLSKRKREQDALMASCWDFARRYSRSPAHELELQDWSDRLFGESGLKETPEERRLRHAACLLADIGWRAHPDYRAERSLGMISQSAFVGIDHAGRLFLALAVYYRYEGPDGQGLSADYGRLLGNGTLERARVLALLFRLAYILSAAMPGLLPKIGLATDEKTITLAFPKKLSDLMGERVQKRLGALAVAIRREPRIEIGS